MQIDKDKLWEAIEHALKRGEALIKIERGQIIVKEIRCINLDSLPFKRDKN